MGKKQVATFDFDGTITRRDTLIEFIRFAKGNGPFLWGFMLYSPLLIAFKLRLYPNWKAKQRIFTHFFGGMKYADFTRLCQRFYQERGEGLVYKEAKKRIEKHLSEKTEIVVITASVEDWVRPFTEAMHIQHLLGTKLEVTSEGKLTGRFSTPNCYGLEKVNRLKELYPERETYHLTAYGDSRGDKELLDYADERNYKLFRQ
jgi:HAD superfamily hydrolase (TIGR01490 family)